MARASRGNLCFQVNATTLCTIIRLLSSLSLAWIVPQRTVVQNSRGRSVLHAASPPGISRSSVIQHEVAAVTSAALLWPALRRPVYADDENPASEAAPVPTAPLPKLANVTVYDFSVPYEGERVPLSNYRNKAVLVVNAKSDDPEAVSQIPILSELNNAYGKQGLGIWLFTTEQGTFETDEDRVIRIKYQQQYGFGDYPRTVIFDKIDIVGKRADPLYKYLCLSLRNPNKIARITLNFEKFLLDRSGRPIRRYPRKFRPNEMEEDIQAVLAGKPIPPPSPQLIKAWRDAMNEAERSEYAFKKGLNYYEPLGQDMRNLP